MSAAGKMFGLAGQVAVVTGASSGIGRRIAQGLAEAGARVVAVARREAALRELQAEAVAADLSAIEDWDGFAARLAAPWGPPTILVNAAGVNLREAPGAVTQSSWDATLRLNLSAPFFLARAMLGRFDGEGAIVNIASLQSSRAFANGMAYGASKGGVAQLTRAMAEAWGARGVRANALAPGFFPTELTQAVFDDAALASRHAAQTCLGRNGALEELVGPAVFLCSPAARYVTGQVLCVDGGYTAK